MADDTIVVESNSVVIGTERLERLIRNERLLFSLQTMGVYNWEGYEEALKMAKEDKD